MSSALELGLAQEAGVDLNEPRARALLSALRALDDVPRLRSTHPGGFVLSCEPLSNYLPIEQTTLGRTIIQFDKDDLDAAGVPKFDFLGLGGLSATHLAFDAIEKRTGEKLEMYRLPLDDAKTYWAAWRSPQYSGKSDPISQRKSGSSAPPSSCSSSWSTRGMPEAS